MNAHQSDKNASYVKWKEWKSDAFCVCSNKDAAVFASELILSGLSIARESHILEIGFGNGSFAAWALARTCHYVGTENNDILVNRAIQHGLEAHSGTSNLADIVQGRKFDLIAIFDVLEHMELNEAIQLLHSAGEHLAPSGKIVIRVPSGDSPFSGHLLHGDITHKLYLGRLAFFQLSEITGLEVVSIHDSAFPITGMGLSTAIRRITITFMRAVIGRLLKLAYYANEPVVLSPTLTAVLRRKRTNLRDTDC